MATSKKSSNTVWHAHTTTREQRAEQKKHKSCLIWLTGLSGSGKSTLANALEDRLFNMGLHTYVLDGDNVRHGLNGDLGFSDADRTENIRRIGEVGKLMVDAGLIVMTAFISPFKEDRQKARDLLNQGDFIEVYTSAKLEVCEVRDPKGLYKKARAGEIREFTGISSPYEAPEAAEITVHTDQKDVPKSVDQIVEYLQKNGYIS